MNLQDLFESQQQCPECGGPAFSDLILAEKKDACYNKVRSRYKVWPSAYASGALVQCRKKGAANWGNKSEGVAEGSEGQKFIVTYNNSLSNDLYTVMVSADDEYDAKDKVRYALGMGDRITDVKSARGNEPTDREYKVFVDPKTSQKRSGIYDRQQGLAEDVELAEEFDLIETIIDRLAEHNGVDAEVIWEDLESLPDDELYVFAVTTPLMEDWQKVNKRDKTDGMSRKAVKAYRRENPGSKLKTAVTTKPSKLKKGGKASKRRKSYCSRSRGQMKMHSISCAKTPDKAICKARRRWNCESIDFNLSEMDKSQTSPGRDGDIDWTKKQMHLGPEHVIKAKDVAQHALKALDKSMKKSHPNTPKKQGVAEAFGPLPKDNQQIRLGRHTVDIERVGLNKNYISFAWHDSKGQEHYEEVAVGDLGSYNDLIDRIKQEISYQERKYTDQGVAEMRNTDDPMDDMIEDYLDYLESVDLLNKSREEEKAQLIADLESGVTHSSEIGYALSGTKWDPLKQGMAEGLAKDIKRLATGKDVKSRAGQEIAKSQDASMKGDIRTSKKHFDRYDKLDKLANKQQGMAEAAGLYGPFTVTINTGERPQSRTKTKKFRREDDAILWAQDWLDDFPQYSFATAQVTDPEGNVVWTTDEQGVAEGSGDISSMIQQYEDMVELVYDLPPGQKKNIAIDRRDALEAQIEAMPGGSEALRQWAKSYNDAMDEGVAEGNEEKIGGRYDPEEFDAMIGRLKKLAGAGPLKTVWDPVKRVYKNVPVAQQPKPQPR